jgi:hypothetical protein
MEDQHEHKIVDLDDKKVLAALEKDGLMVHMGHPSHLSISGDDQKGYSWIINEDSCAKIADVEVLDGRPMMRKGGKKDGEKKDGEKKDGDEKEDEKKLRQDDKKDDEKKSDDKKDDDAEDEDDKTYMAITGKKEGECKFQMVWAESWDSDWEEPKTWPEDAKVVEFGVMVMAAEKDEEKKDEKKDEEGDKDAKEKDE